MKEYDRSRLIPFHRLASMITSTPNPSARHILPDFPCPHILCFRPICMFSCRFRPQLLSRNGNDDDCQIVAICLRISISICSIAVQISTMLATFSSGTTSSFPARTVIVDHSESLWTQFDDDALPFLVENVRQRI